jgi:hypothetical protein
MGTKKLMIEKVSSKLNVLLIAAVLPVCLQQLWGKLQALSPSPFRHGRTNLLLYKQIHQMEMTAASRSLSAAFMSNRNIPPISSTLALDVNVMVSAAEAATTTAHATNQSVNAAQQKKLFVAPGLLLYSQTTRISKNQ